MSTSSEPTSGSAPARAAFAWYRSAEISRKRSKAGSTNAETPDLSWRSRPHCFERENGQPDTLWNAGMRFNTLFRRCGLKPPRGSGRVGLRVHDLRHNSESRIIPSPAVVSDKILRFSEG